MKTLQNILKEVRAIQVIGDVQREVSGLYLDSRKVQPGGVFFALPGTKVDGHTFIDKAIAQGAYIVVCENLPEVQLNEVTYIQVENASQAMAQMAANYYDNPSTKLKLVGVTGTNGKTTVATGLYRLFMAMGYPAGLLSTVAYNILDETLPATHTTPHAIALNECLAKMVEKGCEYAFMEVSSHALVQNRSYALQFAGAVFTNLSRDHLDYHKTFAAYRDAKKILFDNLPNNAFALVNADDKNGAFMLQNCKAAVQQTYSLHRASDFKTRILANDMNGLLLALNDTPVQTRMVGTFNAYNVLCMYAVARLFEKPFDEIATALSVLQAAPGRFERVGSPQSKVIGIVDYAHTPDALENVLETLKAVCKKEQSIITVVGCGGDRDAGKRPQMAGIAVAYSHRVVLTSDNPRTEDPEQILNDMQAGIAQEDRGSVLRITDRAEAIRTAVQLAQAGDMVLVAGKGHETYQEINGIRHDFDDREVLLNALNQTA